MRPPIRSTSSTGKTVGEAVQADFFYPGARVLLGFKEDEAESWYGAMVCTFDQSDAHWLVAFDDGEYREMSSSEISEGVQNGSIRPMEKVSTLLEASSQSPCTCCHEYNAHTHA